MRSHVTVVSLKKGAVESRKLWYDIENTKYVCERLGICRPNETNSQRNELRLFIVP